MYASSWMLLFKLGQQQLNIPLTKIQSVYLTFNQDFCRFDGFQILSYVLLFFFYLPAFTDSSEYNNFQHIYFGLFKKKKENNTFCLFFFVKELKTQSDQMENIWEDQSVFYILFSVSYVIQKHTFVLPVDIRILTKLLCANWITKATHHDTYKKKTAWGRDKDFCSNVFTEQPRKGGGPFKNRKSVCRCEKASSSCTCELLKESETSCNDWGKKDLFQKKIKLNT